MEILIFSLILEGYKKYELVLSQLPHISSTHVQDESEKAHKMFTKVVKKAKERGVNVGVSISMEFYIKK
jgi:hypothetical protein